MKSKLIPVGLVIVAVLLLLGCSGAAEDITIAGNPSADEKVEVAVGGSVTLILESNPTTGFSWPEEAQISNPTVLEQIDHEYAAPDSGMLGASGQEVWTFHALKEGTSTVYLEYSRPWEGGEKAELTYTLTVTVK